MYYFYIVRGSDNSLYCGITTDVKRRIDEHNSPGKKGSKYLRSKKPVFLVFSEEHLSKSSSLKRELEVKKWPKAKKEELISKNV